MSGRKSLDSLLGSSATLAIESGLLKAAHESPLAGSALFALQNSAVEQLRQQHRALGIFGSLDRGMRPSLGVLEENVASFRALAKSLAHSMATPAAALRIGGLDSSLAVLGRSGTRLQSTGAHDGAMGSLLETIDMLSSAGRARSAFASMGRAPDHERVVAGVRAAVAAATQPGIAALAGLRANPMSRSTETFAALVAHLTVHDAIGTFARSVLAVGAAGRFDSVMTATAAAAAAYVENAPDSDPTVEAARESSILVDAIAEVGTLARDPSAASAADVERRVVIVLDAVASRFADRLASATSAERPSLIALLTLLLTVINTVVPLYYGEVARTAADGGTKDMAELRGTISSASDREVEAIGRLQSSIDKLVETLQAARDDAPLPVRIVDRRAAVRVRRSTKAAKVGDLQPGQVVTLRAVEGKWARVEYFDYLKDVLVTGWVSKKYLRHPRADGRPGRRPASQ